MRTQRGDDTPGSEPNRGRRGTRVDVYRAFGVPTT